MSTQHWEQVYQTKASTAVSWYQPHAQRSLAMIRASGISLDAPIIDVGSGASMLIDDLLDAGFRQLTVLDIAASALTETQKRLGARAASLQWVVGDITTVALPGQAYTLWHDRAVFHFLTEPQDRQRYFERMTASVQDHGHVILATFAEDGPEKCSGLPVQRYSAASLASLLQPAFTLQHSEIERHHTPAGSTQSFLYCHFIKSAMTTPAICQAEPI